MNQTAKKNKLIEVYMMLAVDLVLLYLSYVMAYFVRYKNIRLLSASQMHKSTILCFVIVCIVYSLFFENNREFIKRGYYVEFVAVTKYVVGVLLAGAVFLFFFKIAEDFSRLMFGYFAVIFEISTYAAHVVTKKLLRNYYRSGRADVKVMVVSTWEGLEEILANLKKVMPVNYQISYLAITDKELSGSEQFGIKVIAGGDDLLEVVKHIPLDEVFLNIPGMGKKKSREMIRAFESMGAICHYNIEIADWNERESTIGKFGDYTVVTYAISQHDDTRLMIKRLMDIAGGIVGLILTAFLTVFIAIAIKIDSKGPVFFAQTRIGKNGRRFKMYKFRSMYIDAEERKKELESQNEMSGLMFKMKDDPRITRVGKFLRKTSLDELPQFYNILKGDMSLVGTRPPTEDEFDQYSLYYRRRLCMTPGLTGLWQVSGRSNIEDFDDVVKYDLEYIDNWTLGLDIKILFQTIGAVVARKGSS